MHLRKWIFLHVRNFVNTALAICKIWCIGLFINLPKNGHIHYKIFFKKKLDLLKSLWAYQRCFWVLGGHHTRADSYKFSRSCFAWKLKGYHWQWILSSAFQVRLTRFTFEKCLPSTVSLLLNQPQGAFLEQPSDPQGAADALAVYLPLVTQTVKKRWQFSKINAFCHIIKDTPKWSCCILVMRTLCCLSPKDCWVPVVATSALQMSTQWGRQSILFVIKPHYYKK